MAEKKLFFNGINGVTGDYSLAPRTPEQVFKMARGEKFVNDNMTELRLLADKLQKRLSPIAGKDPKNLSDVGWGVIFAKNQNPDIEEALKPLLEHRKRQATQKDERYYKKCIYHPEQSKQDFLFNHHVGSGPANPEKMPYYLMIVGDPKTIPYSFQYQLDVQYAVGRIHFDTIEDYANYARNVVEAETGKRVLSRRISFFGVRHDYDEHTQLSADYLIQPLADFVKKQPDWSVETILREKATKVQLSQLMGGAQTPPVLLFTASHGVMFPNGHKQQISHQGALICQDWPGLGNEPDPQKHYFSADDIGSDANLLGLISFHFACYSAGTPKEDNFEHHNPEDIAPHAFVARLPQRLLSRGALAVIGHIDQACGESFKVNSEVFKSTLKQLMEGHPVGAALEFFNQRYAELSSDIWDELEKNQPRNTASYDDDFVNMWVAKNDARNYTIIGDPAVRLNVKENIITNDNLVQRVEQLEQEVKQLQAYIESLQQQINVLSGM